MNEKASAVQVGGGHYKTMPIQPAEFCQRNKLPWCESNVIKYVCRHREKNGSEDIRKAIHYLNLLLEWDYPSLQNYGLKFPEHLRDVVNGPAVHTTGFIASELDDCSDEEVYPATERR